MAATHRGTCQVCGRIQAVNEKPGLLANHGYTVDWGFFSGICRGSKHLPFEKDCSLVVKSITWAEARIAQIAEEIEETKNWNIEDKHPTRVNLDYTMTRSTGMAYVNALIVDDIEKWGRKNVGVRFTLHGKEISIVNRECGVYTKEILFEKTKERNIWRLEREAKQLEEYKVQQQTRVDNWVEADLMEIKR